MRNGVNNLPLVVTVTAIMTLFVLLVDDRPWTVFVPLMLRVLFAVFVYLEGIMESVHFICHQELLRKREENKQKLSKFH